jgi:low affinity Fe/Cu permease
MVNRMARWLTEASGSTAAITLSFLIVIIWAAVGPLFGYSDTWQLVINTLTTVATFNMVFVIQRSQNHGDRALHAKLDDIIHALDRTHDQLIGIERKDVQVDEVVEEIREVASDLDHTATRAE